MQMCMQELTGLALHRSGKGCWTMLHVTFKHLLGMTRRHVLKELLNSLMNMTGRNNISSNIRNTDHIISISRRKLT